MQAAPKPVERGNARAEIELLREENRQLRELVIQLSKIVIRNVLEQK